MGRAVLVAELVCRTLGSVFWMVLVTLILCTDLDDPCALLNESAMIIEEDLNAMTDARTNMPLVSAADSDYTPYSELLCLDN